MMINVIMEVFMTLSKEKIFELINSNPVGYVSTSENGKPHVRGILMFRADENGIIFHTGVTKDFYKQIVDNQNTEICYACGQYQIRVSGQLEIVEDKALLDEIIAHPSRQFMRTWIEKGVVKNLYDFVKVCRLKNGKASVWTMESNFLPKEYIQL